MFSPDGGSTDMKLYIGENGRTPSGNASNSFLARNGLAHGSWYYLNASLPSLGNTNAGTFDTSPGDPTRAVLGDQDSGVFTFDFDLTFAGGFDAGASGFTITKISNESGGSGSLDSPDNGDWTDATTLDNGSGEIWQMNPGTIRSGSAAPRSARSRPGSSTCPGWWVTSPAAS